MEAHEFKGGGEDDLTKENCGAPIRDDKEGYESGVSFIERTGKVGGRFGFSVIAYNMKRAISIKGVRALIQSL